MACLAVMVTTTAVLAGTATASAAATPAWAPFSYCPVDNPLMINSPASSYGTECAATTSPSGTFQIGKTTITTGAINMQFGVSGQDHDIATYGAVVPADGASR